MSKRPAKNPASTSSNAAVRGQYESFGVRGFYERFGAEYRNPHEEAVRKAIKAGAAKWDVNFDHVLDLACGSGEVTLALREMGYTHVDGIDPYTGDAYLERTGREAERLTFGEIADGGLADRRYTLIICSFALHLPEKSRLPMLMYQLSLAAPDMIVITPHKRPRIRPAWGWQCRDEIVVDRVRARHYESAHAGG